MASIEITDENPINVSLGEENTLVSSVSSPETVSVTSTDGWYEKKYEETDPIFEKSPASDITNEDIENWNDKSEFSGDYDDLTNKPTIPSKTSDLTNDSDFVEDSSYVHTDNNFTTEEKTKLSSVESGAEANKIDKIKVNGTEQTITSKTIDISVPTNNNQLTNGAGYVTNTVNNLTNYELKTNTGASIDLSIDSSTYVVTASLKNSGGNVLNSKTIDLPLESVVVNGSYDSTNKKVILTLQSGSTIEFSVADLISGLQSEITSNNKLDSDLVDDTNQTNKFVTTSEKSTWSGKQDFLVSGTNIKTINNTSLLGSGNISLNIPTNTSDLVNDGDGIGDFYALTNDEGTGIGITDEEISDDSRAESYDAYVYNYNTPLFSLAKKSDIPDVTDYVKNTDYATKNTGGVVKIDSAYGLKVNSSGTLYTSNENYSTYSNANNNFTISKGTLENVITGKQLTNQTDLSAKQDNLVSGTNIKTINNQSILGSGNITIQGGGSGDGDMLKSVYDTNDNGIVDNAEKVNNHTVGTDVPSNAVFTDTVYDDTSIRQELNDKADSSDIPTKTSDLTNDSGFITLETDPTVPSWAKQSTKPNYDGSEISIDNSQIINSVFGEVDYSAITNAQNGFETIATQIAINTDDIEYLKGDKVDKITGKGLSTNDFTTAYKNNVDSNTSARHTHSNKSVLDGISSTDITNWNNKSTFSGSYNDLTNKPTIPSKTSDLENNGTDIDDYERYAITMHTDNNTAVSAGNGIYVDYNGYEEPVVQPIFDYEILDNYSLAFQSDIPTKTSDLTNDSGFLTSETDPTVPSWAKQNTKPSYQATEVSVDGSNLEQAGTSMVAIRSATETQEALRYISRAVKYNKEDIDTINNTSLPAKQDTLVSGTNIKTINSISLLGSGDISLEEEPPLFVLDDILNINSTSDENYIGITDAIENDKMFYIIYSDAMLGKFYRFVPTKCDYDGNSHYFYFMNTNDINNSDDVYTEVKLQNTSGTSVTVTTREFYKQDKLVSGTNIKTINGNSILGSGDITVDTPVKSEINCYSATQVSTTSSGAGVSDLTVIPLTQNYKIGSKFTLSGNKIYIDSSVEKFEISAKVYFFSGNSVSDLGRLNIIKNGNTHLASALGMVRNYTHVSLIPTVIENDGINYIELRFNNGGHTGVKQGIETKESTFIRVKEL